VLSDADVVILYQQLRSIRRQHPIEIFTEVRSQGGSWQLQAVSWVTALESGSCVACGGCWHPQTNSWSRQVALVASCSSSVCRLTFARNLQFHVVLLLQACTALRRLPGSCRMSMSFVLSLFEHPCFCGAVPWFVWHLDQCARSEPTASTQPPYAQRQHQRGILVASSDAVRWYSCPGGAA
jgi:hypothetical protein